MFFCIRIQFMAVNETDTKKNGRIFQQFGKFFRITLLMESAIPCIVCGMWLEYWFSLIVCIRNAFLYWQFCRYLAFFLIPVISEAHLYRWHGIGSTEAWFWTGACLEYFHSIVIFNYQLNPIQDYWRLDSCGLRGWHCTSKKIPL